MANSTLEERIVGLEGSYKELTKHIDDLRSETYRGFDLVRSLMNELRSEFRTTFRWTMSLILINWLSVLAAVFPVAARK